MTKEMIREGKLRPYGVVAGEKISDPRNYAYIDYDVTNHDSAVNVNVRLSSGRTIYSSSLGRLDYTIFRAGWVQTTIELPPNTKQGDIVEVTFECLVAPPESGKQLAHSGTCHIGNAYGFMLQPDFAPSPRFTVDVNADIPTGQAIALKPYNAPRRIPVQAPGR
jgi:hypothetical protein